MICWKWLLYIKVEGIVAYASYELIKSVIAIRPSAVYMVPADFYSTVQYWRAIESQPIPKVYTNKRKLTGESVELLGGFTSQDSIPISHKNIPQYY